MITLVLLTLSFVSYALINGTTEALYYDLRYHCARKHPNIHWLYVTERCLVLYYIASQLPDKYSTTHWWIFVFCLSFTYSFFHNGIYGVIRNTINPDIYIRRWWANKEHGEAQQAAWWEITAGFRTAMAIVGLTGSTFLYFSANT